MSTEKERYDTFAESIDWIRTISTLESGIGRELRMLQGYAFKMNDIMTDIYSPGIVCNNHPIIEGNMIVAHIGILAQRLRSMYERRLIMVNRLLQCTIGETGVASVSLDELISIQPIPQSIKEQLAEVNQPVQEPMEQQPQNHPSINEIPFINQIPFFGQMPAEKVQKMNKKLTTQVATVNNPTINSPIINVPTINIPALGLPHNPEVQIENQSTVNALYATNDLPTMNFSTAPNGITVPNFPTINVPAINIPTLVNVSNPQTTTDQSLQMNNVVNQPGGNQDIYLPHSSVQLPSCQMSGAVSRLGSATLTSYLAPYNKSNITAGATTSGTSAPDGTGWTQSISPPPPAPAPLVGEGGSGGYLHPVVLPGVPQNIYYNVQTRAFEMVNPG